MKTDAALTNYLTTKKKVDNLFALQKITLTDIEDFNKMERDYLAATATEMLNQLKGEERDNFISKIEQIIPANTKNQFWEHNHFLIGRAINKLMREYGFMPSKSAIAEETGLSRQTVTKHLKDYKTNPEYLAEIEQFKFMAPKVLGTVFKFATNGDVKAARLYFEMIGAINKQRSNTVVNEQTNYIQINNTILSQENLKQLSVEQLNQIECIVTGSAGK
ncbi:MAG: hypothetical protein JWR09_1525 [Mucilaginibacter sp.]|nr:hypothetical protein [Mucilaginibacter sp.]